VADADVTVDGRPLLWKLRNESDITNDVHYFIAGVEHYSGLGPATYSYLGMGPANDTPDGPVRQGLNSQGLAVGWNVLNSGGWKKLHHQALGHYNTISQVRPYVNAMTDLSTYNYFIDFGGEATLWENQTGDGQHWEYNTRDSDRDTQWIDVDNADGDNDYSTGVDVSFSGWVVRANAPAHYNNDGTDDPDDPGLSDRYRAGRDVIGALIYNSGSSTALSAKSIAASFFRHDTLAKDTTVSNMIVHGVLPTEDPRLSTMWTLLGHTETGIFVPVWIHGVESGGTNAVPPYLDNGDDGVCVYGPAKGMHNAGFNETHVQARTIPFEEHLFDVVTGKLLPEWRDRDWTDPAVVITIGEEMKRVQEQLDADAYWHLKYLYDHGATSNYAPTISIDSVTANGLEVTFSVTADDADGGGEGLTYLFDYGDGQISSDRTHVYDQAGRYLVSCTVTDENGVSQTDWLFVTVKGHRVLSGLGETSSGWSEAFAGDYSHADWLRVGWGAYNSASGEARVATGDIDGDERDEIVLGLAPVAGDPAIPGGWFQVLDDDYTHLAWGRINWGAYNSTDGESWPACGDVDGDGDDEIVIGLGSYPSNGGWFEVFDYATGHVAHKAWKRVNWGVYNGANGETRPACGDIDGDGRDEIVIGLGTGAGGWLEVFDDEVAGYVHLAWARVDWDNYNDALGESWPACGDVNGDGDDEIVIGLGSYPADGGWFEVLDYSAGLVTHTAWKQVNWGVYNNANGETRPTCGDVDGDGRDEMVIGLGTGGEGYIEVFDDASAAYVHLEWAHVHWSGYCTTSGETWPAVKR
jgi:hypothetical protein